MQDLNGITVTDANDFTSPGMADRAGEKDNEGEEYCRAEIFHRCRISHRTLFDATGIDPEKELLKHA